MLKIRGNIPMIPVSDGVMILAVIREQAEKTIVAMGTVNLSIGKVSNVPIDSTVPSAETKIMEALNKIRRAPNEELLQQYPMIQHLSKFATFAMSGKAIDESTRRVVSEAIKQQKFSVDFFMYMTILHIMHELPDAMNASLKIDKIITYMAKEGFLDSEELLKYYTALNQRIQYMLNIVERRSSNAPFDSDAITKLMSAMNKDGKETSDKITKTLETITPRSREKIRNVLAKLSFKDVKKGPEITIEGGAEDEPYDGPMGDQDNTG